LLEEYDSEETIDRIASALESLGHEVLRFGGGRRFLEGALAISSSPRGIDLVFNIAEGRGFRSREAHVPAVCEMLGLLYTHSDPLTLALSLDKPLAKRVVKSYGVSTAPHLSIERLEELRCRRLPPFPVIAKPACEGSSMGIRKGSRCDDREQLEKQVTFIFETYRGPVIVEEFLTGVEVTVGIAGTGNGARVLGAMEIAPRKIETDRFIYCLEVKRNYRDEVDYHVPPRLPETVNQTVAQTALDAYRALGCRDIARIDLRLNANGDPCFMEANPLPGLNPVTGDLPILCDGVGIAYDALIAMIVNGAISRETGAFSAKVFK
jgi:D-alanine-D-alanine ligase